MNFFKVIKTCFDKGDIVACISGDEFAVITYKEDITKPILVMILFINHYEDTIMSNLHFSYGVKEYSDDFSLEDLYYMADIEMYAYKKINKNQ